MEDCKSFDSAWSAQEALENMEDGDKIRVGIFTVEKQGRYWFTNNRHFESSWSLMGYIDAIQAELRK